jgi:hypothetical protein
VSEPFVAGLRARAETLRLASAGENAITIRVEMPEVWDVVRIATSPDEPVMSVKVSALAALAPDATMPQAFVVKLAGWEILDESVSLAEAGVVDGSILLLTNRRRRAVR